MKNTRVSGLPLRAAALLALTLPLAAQTLVDTAGFTDRDRQVYGPALRYIVNDALRGIHVVWKDGYGDICYNFRPQDSTWRWPGGTLVSPYARNLGCLDVDRSTGKAVVGTDYVLSGESQTSYFQDSLAGRGRFRERDVVPRFRGLLAASSYYVTLFAGERNDTVFGLSLFTFQRIGRVGAFPGYNLAAGKRSGRFGYIWAATDGPDCGTLYLKETPNNGANWYAAVNLSDSAPGPLTRSLLGGFALYDSIRLYLVTGFYDGWNPNRSEIWLYAKYEDPPWTMVHRFSLPDMARIGDHALACCRPSIAQNPYNSELYVAWEQFDPGNMDPLTGLCRADVWASRSCDSGRTWGEAVRLTQPDGTSKRFPFLAEVADDTLRIICFADSVAGFWEQGQGPRTRNPVLYLRIPTGQLPTGLQDRDMTQFRPRSWNRVPELGPSLSARGFTVSCQGPSLIEVFDHTGRRLLARATSGTVRDLGAGLPAGVYFIRARPSGSAPTVLRVLKVR